MISHEAEKQFSDLADSVWEGNATIVECLDEEGRTYPVICMVRYDGRKDVYDIIPLALPLSALLLRIVPPPRIVANAPCGVA